ncbi:hypothetical protein DICA3_E10770 [Diutina catenulata]
MTDIYEWSQMVAISPPTSSTTSSLPMLQTKYTFPRRLLCYKRHVLRGTRKHAPHLYRPMPTHPRHSRHLPRFRREIYCLEHHEFRSLFHRRARVSCYRHPVLENAPLILGLELGGLSSTIVAQEMATNPPTQSSKDVPEPTELAENYISGFTGDFYRNIAAWGHDNIYAASGNHLWQFHPTFQCGGGMQFDSAVSAVACGPMGMTLVATICGAVHLVYDQAVQSTIHSHSRVSCILWLRGSQAVVGDIRGSAHILDVYNWTLYRYRSFVAGTSAVCGMASDGDNRLLAIGCNDNACRVFSIKNRLRPSFKWKFPHNGAVKGVAFCPWCPTLLATGGGVCDKSLKFWHFPTGTLLATHRLGAQISSVYWSRTCKQLVVTFGFNDDGVILAVYTFPELNVTKQVRVQPQSYCRITSSSMNPDGDSILVAMDTGHIRRYRLWEVTQYTLAPVVGSVGSSLLDLSTGSLELPQWR